jgi:hypothetical protein
MKKCNPLKDRIDLHIQLGWPTLSWSSMNAFESYDKDEWYEKFVLGKRGIINPAMQAGIDIGERWATDETFLPTVERPEIFEQQLDAVFSSIKLTGHIDGLTLHKKKKLFELKTAQSNLKWTPKSVRKWGQIDFYLLLIWLNYKLKPEDFEIELIYVPVSMNGDFKVVQSGKPVIIPTKRTMIDILNFGTRLKKIYKEMHDFVIHKQSLQDTSK